MRVFKRGKKYYSYEFELRGKRYKKSTKCTNATDALGIAAAARLEIINGNAGLHTRNTPAPTLKQFEQTFLDWVNSDFEKVRTREYYAANYRKLLEYTKVANLRLDEIDEPVIESFKIWALARVTKLTGAPVTKATVNRYLSTLKKALRYAHRKLKLIEQVPVITLFRGERNRDYVFSDEDFNKWLEYCPEPLRSASVLARYSGICRSEMIALQKDSVNLLDEADSDGSYGEIQVRRGLKRECRRRTLKVNRAMKEVLERLILKSKCQHVFTAIKDQTKPLHSPVLSHQLQRVKVKGAFHKDACLHTLRHTFLTEMGEITDAFTLQKIAGHTRIETTMRYVHPQKKAINSAFQRFFAGSPQ